MRIKTYRKENRISTPQLVVAAFAAAIAVGTFLLALPIANTDGSWNMSVNALFTATSATCVTGLDAVGIGTAYTGFGLGVILALSQLGGIGIMTAGTFFFLAMGKRLSINEERAIMSTLGADVVGGVSGIIRSTLLFTFSWELMGTALLAWRLNSAHGYEPAKALWHGMFMSVMAFCNSGLGLLPDNLGSFAHDRLIVTAMMTIVVVGGIGFIVHANILSLRPWRKARKNRGRLSLHSTIVIASTALIVFGGGALLLLLEWHGAYGDLPVIDKIIAALFQTTTSRTAGFAILPTTGLRHASIVFLLLTMFIGAAPGSTGGGIKVTTAAILFATVRSMLRNREQTELHGRTIPTRIVNNAVTITLISMLAVGISVFAVMLTEERSGISFERTMFEVISAFSTTGLSLDVTSMLSNPGKMCIIICMFIGRVGPVTLAMAMAAKSGAAAKRYPEENVIVG